MLENIIQNIKSKVFQSPVIKKRILDEFKHIVDDIQDEIGLYIEDYEINEKDLILKVFFEDPISKKELFQIKKLLKNEYYDEYEVKQNKNTISITPK